MFILTFPIPPFWHSQLSHNYIFWKTNDVEEHKAGISHSDIVVGQLKGISHSF